ncbi:MAG: DUF4383 domain-containing protein [Actinomycetota bacterium]|nr:DUF4383 domain-containing protein [Actinomycetota bacterium]
MASPLGSRGVLLRPNVSDRDRGSGAGGERSLFGIFETNGWHTLAALILGAITTYFTLNPERAREAALGIGLFHVAVVAALEVFDPSTFWIASNGADQIVHATTAVGALAAGLATRPTRHEQPATAST